MVALEAKIHRVFPSSGDLEAILQELKQIRNGEQDDLSFARSIGGLDVDAQFERGVCIEEMNEGVRIIRLLMENKDRLITTLCAAAAAGKGE